MKTLRRILAALAIVVMTTPAFAESKAITVAQALNMLQAHRALDGRQVVAKVNGIDQVVTTPFDFGSGTFRLKVARNIGALLEVEKNVEDSRQKIVAEITRNMPVGKEGQPPSIAQGTPEYDVFTKQISDILNAPAQVTLARIRASELKLDKNEIPVTTLSALEPILDE